MLVLDRETGSWSDEWFRDLPRHLRAGDVLILNDSRVIPARLFGHRVLKNGTSSAGRVEVLLLEQKSADEWTALARPGRNMHPGQHIIFANDAVELRAEVIAAGERGERTVRFEHTDDFWQRLESLGHMPLPPYIHRNDTRSDRERYQTVFSRERGSAAAPTAGLHFTKEILTTLRAQGVETHNVTLHVGLGTFQPLSEESLRKQQLHEERYTLPAQTADAIRHAKAEGRRIIAVGTTVVRTLEHCALQPGGLHAHSGRTRIFIQPGFQFRIVDALLTNFHLPQSSLLMLVAAFAGHARVLGAYNHAVAAGYRFFSYGDCMFLA